MFVSLLQRVEHTLNNIPAPSEHQLCRPIRPSQIKWAPSNQENVAEESFPSDVINNLAEAAEKIQDHLHVLEITAEPTNEENDFSVVDSG